MSVHPFASQCDGIIARLEDILANLRKAKKSTEKPEGQWWDWVDSLGRKRVVTRIFGRRNLGPLAANDQERSTAVEPGEANAALSKKALRMKQDGRLAALQERYWRELARCVEARRNAAANGSRTLDDGSIVAAQGKKGVSIPCPKADAARRALDAYLTATYGSVGPGSGSNSGGGGGGGW